MKKAQKGWKLFFFIGAGGLLSFQIFTLCRTAWITSVVLTVVYGILVIRRLWGDRWSRLMARGVALCLMVVLTFLPVFLTIRWLPTLTHYRVWLDGEYSVDKVHSFDPPDSEKYIELDEFWEEFGGRIIHTLRKTEAMNPLLLRVKAMEEKMETENQQSSEKSVETDGFLHKDLVELPWTDDPSTRIRITIYKAYLEDMTWVGNPSSRGYYRIGEDAVSWHAQNLWIQVGYSFGIPAGFCLIVLTIMIFVTDGKWAKRGTKDPFAIIPLMVSLVFFVFGLTEVVWLPGQLILFLMFFAHHPGLVADDAPGVKVAE